ncbi:unannotated protein [freshwater metagenome]|uniref:glutamyl-tRNA reductase n=1 Tax=freshwater metagenome TaxID=449393 RepID=A0A6J7DQC5_9ZZZZ|nr:glutamyl-tRNA reductase [Actinomycetota bacterium]MUH58266.1 glutamyl-tRNA reductase [Actinomycetota bacterium]
MSFLSVGLNHERATLDLLERVTVPDDEFGKALGTLLANANIQEAVLVSTCLRTEVYAVIDRFHGAVEEITATLSTITNVPEDEISPVLEIHFDRGVSTHLFSVAAGLKSVVPGEFEVLGQLRRSLERAEEEHAVGAELSALFQRAIAAGRKVRSETAIARGTTSFAQATVDLIRHELGATISGATAIVYGAGQLGQGIVKGLSDDRLGLERIMVANRTVANADAVLVELADDRIKAVSLEEASQHLHQASIVVTAIEVPHTLLSISDFAGSQTPVLIVDLGMPRVVDGDVDTLLHVRRLDIAHLREVIDRSLAERRDEIQAAEEILRSEVEKYLEDRRSRGAASIVSELRERFEDIRRMELSKRQSDFSFLTADQWEMVESLTRSIVAKIAHQPTLGLKDSAGTDRGQRLTEALRNLFDL